MLCGSAPDAQESLQTLPLGEVLLCELLGVMLSSSGRRNALRKVKSSSPCCLQCFLTCTCSVIRCDRSNFRKEGTGHCGQKRLGGRGRQLVTSHLLSGNKMGECCCSALFFGSVQDSSLWDGVTHIPDMARGVSPKRSNHSFSEGKVWDRKLRSCLPALDPCESLGTCYYNLRSVKLLELVSKCDSLRGKELLEVTGHMLLSFQHAWVLLGPTWPVVSGVKGL